MVWYFPRSFYHIRSLDGRIIPSHAWEAKKLSLAIRVAIYIRVSTEEQAKEGYSIAAQKERLTAFAHSQGWDIFDFYIDEGVSAKDTERPELKRMLQDIEGKKLDIVLVYRLDRLTRSVLDLYKLLEVFQKHDVHFRSATEQYDTTSAIGRLFITLVASLAQWERENLGERVKFGMEQKVREGKFPGGSVPFGYNLVDGDLLINEDEAKYVRLIFSKYAQGKNLNEISYLMNQIGVLSPTGSQWNDRTIGYMLDNPIYVGRLRWNYKSGDNYFEVETNYPRIIDDETFEKVRYYKETKKQYHPRTLNQKYIFSGKLICPDCGGVLVGHDCSKPEYPDYLYYRCQGRQDLNRKCKFTSVRDKVIEQEFLQAIGFLIDPQTAREVAATVEVDDDHKEEIERLQKELVKIRRNREKWQRAYADDVISLEDLKARTQEDRNREQWVLEEIERLQPAQPVDRLSIDDIQQLISDLRTNWQTASVEEKKAMVGILVDKIIVHRVSRSKVRLDIEYN